MEGMAESGLAGLMLAMGMIVLIWALSRRRLRRRGSKRSEQPSAAPKTAGDAPSEWRRWHVEMHEAIRDMKGEIDTKLTLLQTLIGMARQESERLERALAQAERLGLFERDDLLAASDAPPTSAAGGTSGAPAPPPWSNAYLREEIGRLAALGEAPEAIARQLGLPAAEVDLVLSLRVAAVRGLTSQSGF